jgi:hypothetical protein
MRAPGRASRLAPRLSVVLAAAAVLSTAGALAAPAGAAHSSATAAPEQLTRGANLQVARTMLTSPYRVQIFTLAVDLDHVRLRPVVGSDAIGGLYESVPSMAQRTHAIAAVNTDFFDLGPRSGEPHGGVVRNGVVWRTPTHGHNANLYIGPNRRAHVGAAPYTATVTIGRGQHTVWAINSQSSIEQGRLVEVTNAEDSIYLRRNCTVVYTTAGKVTAVHTSINRLNRLTGPDDRALVGCGSGARWMRAVRARTAVTYSFTWQNGPIDQLVSGGSVLVRNGRPFSDPTANFFSRWRNPETFACVSASGRYIRFMTIDGRSRLSAGVTFPEIQRYMLSTNCWNGIVFDGGGSTTMYARGTVRNQPADGAPRRIPTGIFVYPWR